MEGKTTRKIHQVLEGEDEGEAHGADRGVKKMGEQKWQFSYGQRAVLHRADENADEDEDEDEDEEEEEEEEEEEAEESTALAQVYTTTTSRLLKTFC
jgi:TATA-binding protein-associated factor Taf7